METARDCTHLGTLFHSIVNDLKASSPAWEDFVNKGMKLHNLLKSTTLAMSAFVESIQKIADFATNTKGSTKDIGSALTRICVRQKMMENKLKHFTNALLDNLIGPVQEHLEEWRKVSYQLEKDHTKDYKRAMHEIKKKNNDTLRLQKKFRKGSKPDLQQQLSSVMHDVNERFTALEETERSALRNLLVEERSRICLFANCLSPVLDLQVSLLTEVTSLHDLTSDLSTLSRNPKQLPTSTEQIVQDFIKANSQTTSPLPEIDSNGFLNNDSEPPSPGFDDSRKSSLCSLNSLTSSDSRSSGSLNRSSSFPHRPFQAYHRRTTSGGGGQGSPTFCKSVAVPRRSSASSHDSGFISTANGTILLNSAPHVGAERLFNQQFSVPHDKTDSKEDVVDGVSPVIRSRSNSEQIPDNIPPALGQNRTFSWMEWSKPGPYDAQPASLLNSDSRRNVLPSKPTPPPLSPKPAYLLPRPEEENTFSRPPLVHANTAPCFFPVLPEKDDRLPLSQSEKHDSLPLVQSVMDDVLPPPPPSLLINGDAGYLDNNAAISTSAPPSPHYQPTSNCLPPHGNAQPPDIPRYVPSTETFPSATLGRKNSNNSIQYSSSSGYSSQNTTPACSEDTIASHDTDHSLAEAECREVSQSQSNGVNYEKYSTLPRNYHHGNESNARNNQHKRPASTTDVPVPQATQADSGTATIRRKPSSKFNSVRRTTSGPKAIQTPTVPNHSVANLASTFLPPSQNANLNSNNNRKVLSDFEKVNVALNPNFPQQKSSESGNLTLRFQPSNDVRDGTPTPTMTPTVGGSMQFHSNHFPTSHTT